MTLIIACKSNQHTFSKRDVQSASKLMSLDFSAKAIDTMYNYLERNRKGYDSLRTYDLDYQLFPSLLFDPYPINFMMPEGLDSTDWFVEKPALPIEENKTELAFYSISELAELLRTRAITSVELTNLYLDRLERYNPILECAITITKELALKQAALADREIEAGQYKGLLHGIPYGVKDLIAVEDYPTTWGAMPYRNQVLDHTASVVKQLEEAGAVLIAKLTSGALARGDVWFGGKTKNPWDTLQGASGSSAGSGSATSAGLVGFSLGTETLGSITSPSTRNGVSGLRPTYGTVSRHGVMSLSWSMDKVGPICRSAKDCAIVYDVIRGKDGLDKTLNNAPFSFKENLDYSNLRFGVLQDLVDKDTTKSGDNLRKALELMYNTWNIKPDTMSLPEEIPFAAFDIILRAEAGAFFDDLVQNHGVNTLVQQTQRSRANSLRQARFIPAVEYLQANRFRQKLIEEIHILFQNYDVILTPTFGGNQLMTTNLTGHPVVCVPTGFDDKNHPTSMSFLGNLHSDGLILSVAHAFQKMTDFDEQHPPFFFSNASDR